MKKQRLNEGTGWGLAEFSRGLEEMADRKRKADLERFESMLTELPNFTTHIKSLEHDALLDQFVWWSGGRSDPKETEIRSQYHDAIRKEILRRMNSVIPCFFAPIG